MKINSLKAAFATEFIDLPRASGIEEAEWEDFQIEYLNNETRFGADVKSRQIAWSFTSAVDAVTDGTINPGTPHVFVSINLNEAKEKIRYAKSIIDATDEPVRPKLIRDSQTELEFENGSRLISYPCRPPRGMARARVYLDEIAHYQNGLDREIYTAALPATTKGDGYIRLGSSPLGAKGLFWEIITESLKKFPGYVRRFTPWWQVRSFCKDLPMAAEIAPEMVTQERVYAFGTTALIQVFENMFLEDFQQEYECAWVDEATAWITWEIIQRNQKPEHLWWHARSVDEATAMIPKIQEAIERKQIEPVLVGGLDVGRKHDLSEFMGLGKATTGQLPLRLSISLDRVEYEAQERCFAEVIKRLPFLSVLIDRNGIGAQLAENLAKKTGKAQGVDFTNPTKELWAVEARLQAERANVPLPMDRDIAYQIHSIKKTVTAAKNNVFDTERNEKHHADKFWSWALGIWAASHGARPIPEDQPQQQSKWRGAGEDTDGKWRRY
jgi:phage FluMu gp28-like protein